MDGAYNLRGLGSLSWVLVLAVLFCFVSVYFFSLPVLCLLGLDIWALSGGVDCSRMINFV